MAFYTSIARWWGKVTHRVPRDANTHLAQVRAPSCGRRIAQAHQQQKSRAHQVTPRHAAKPRDDVYRKLRAERDSTSRNLRSAKIYAGGTLKNIEETQKELRACRWYNDFGRSRALRISLQAERRLLEQRQAQLRKLQQTADKANRAAAEYEQAVTKTPSNRTDRNNLAAARRKALEQAEQISRERRGARIRTDGYSAAMQQADRQLRDVAERTNRYAETARTVRNVAVVAGATVATGGAGAALVGVGASTTSVVALSTLAGTGAGTGISCLSNIAGAASSVASGHRKGRDAIREAAQGTVQDFKTSLSASATQAVGIGVALKISSFSALKELQGLRGLQSLGQAFRVGGISAAASEGVDSMRRVVEARGQFADLVRKGDLRPEDYSAFMKSSEANAASVFRRLGANAVCGTLGYGMGIRISDMQWAAREPLQKLAIRAMDAAGTFVISVAGDSLSAWGKPRTIGQSLQAALLGQAMAKAQHSIPENSAFSYKLKRAGWRMADARERLIESGERLTGLAPSEDLYNPRIATGSGSGSLPGFRKERGLVPTGQLLRSNPDEILVFTGELGFGVMESGINQDCLSFSHRLDLALDYASKSFNKGWSPSLGRKQIQVAQDLSNHAEPVIRAIAKNTIAIESGRLNSWSKISSEERRLVKTSFPVVYGIVNPEEGALNFDYSLGGGGPKGEISHVGPALVDDHGPGKPRGTLAVYCPRVYQRRVRRYLAAENIECPVLPIERLESKIRARENQKEQERIKWLQLAEQEP